MPHSPQAGVTRAFVMGAIACSFGVIVSVVLPGRAAQTS